MSRRAAKSMSPAKSSTDLFAVADTQPCRGDSPEAELLQNSTRARFDFWIVSLATIPILLLLGRTGSLPGSCGQERASIVLPGGEGGIGFDDLVLLLLSAQSPGSGWKHRKSRLD